MESTPTGKIRHTDSRLGQPAGAASSDGKPAAPAPPADQEERLSVAPAGGGSKQIRAFGQMRRHQEEWNRSPNTTGQGAIHCKTFHSKLTEDALAYLDRQINEWLDDHPEYEVKLVSSTIGLFTGKLKEEHLICQVWV